MTADTAVDGTAVPLPPAWRSAAAAAGAVAAGSLPVYLVGALFVQIGAELGFGVAMLGVLVGAYRGSVAVFAVPFGRIADRIRTDRALRLSLLLSVLTLVLCATVARSYAVMFLLLVLSGLAYALGQTAVNVFLAAAVAPGRQGMAVGVKQSAVPVSGLLAGVGVPALALTLGWRSAFWAAAALALAVVPLVPRVAPPPARTGGAAGGRRGAVTAPTLVLGAALALGIAAGATGTAFLVDAGVTAGFAPGTAGLILAVVSGGSIAVRIGTGVLVDRIGIEPLRLVLALLTAGAAGYALMATGGRAAFVAGAVLALMLGWGYNGLFWLAVIRSTPGSTGASTGVILPMGMAGGVVGPLVAGRLVESFSYAAAWSLVGVLLLAAAVLVRVGVAALVRAAVTA